MTEETGTKDEGTYAGSMNRDETIEEALKIEEKDEKELNSDLKRGEKIRKEMKKDFNDGEPLVCLKVKADPPDISPDDRKRNVKKLAGAISHSLRASGEINVRAFGNAAIGKAAKALAIARNYIAVQNLQLECSPAFINSKIGDTDLTGICFCTFASNRPKDAKDVDVEECESVLMVKADPRDVEPETRTKNVKKLASAIAHSLEDNKEVAIRCFGNATIGKASKSLAIARGLTATRGPDLYCWPAFIVANIGGKDRTGIAFFAFTNEI